MRIGILIIIACVIVALSVFAYKVHATPDGPRHYYLARWEWVIEDDFEFWAAPHRDKLVGAVDLRPLPAQGKRGGVPEGYGFFAYTKQVDIPDAVYLGDSLDATLSAPLKAQVRVALNIQGSLQSNTIRDILWDILTVHADPTGQRGPKPLSGSKDEPVQLHLGGHSLIKQEPFGEEHRQRAIQVFQVDYRRNKETNAYPMETLRKWTGATMLELFGEMNDDLAQQILPEGHKTDGWEEPTTTLTEDWNCANSASLDCDLTWTDVAGDYQIVSNRASVQSTAGAHPSRVGSNLSSDEHYAQASVVTLNEPSNPGSSLDAAVALRFAASANTYYYVAVRAINAAADDIVVYKVVTGTFTEIGAPQTVTLTLPGTLKGQINSSDTITSSWRGTQYHSFTDTSITGNLRTGISAWLDTYGAAGDVVLDDWQAADLNSTPADPTSPTQLKTDDATTISNAGYTEETSVTLKASVTDADTTETLTLFFELVANADSFTSTSTPVVGESCASGTAYASCSSKVWYITSASGNYSSTAFTATSTVATLTDGTGYKWQVKGCDDDSACSSWVAFDASTPNFTIDTTAPSTPGTPSTDSPTTDTTPTWTWTASTDGGSGLHATTPYWVEWSTDANFSSSVSSSTASTASFTHSSALADNTWYARIRALDAVSNESSYSSSSTVVVDTTAPSTPGTPSTDSPTTDTTPTWTWTASTDGGSGLHATTPYWVEWSTDSSFASGVSSSTAAAASFTHSTELTDETTWYVRVKAQDAADNESSYSSNGSVAIDTTPPPGPGPSTAGGSAAAGTAFLQQQGYLPSPPVSEPPPPPIVERIPEILQPFIPPFLKPTPEPTPPPPEEFVQEETPLVFQGQWNLLAPEPIRQFVLAPLPREINTLVEKFPELGKTFTKIGITKITDLQKLRATPLRLPGLTESAGLHKGVAIASLSQQEKESIPCEVVFAKTAGQLIDFSTVLSIGESGEAKQKIHTIAGKPLELVVKPCQQGEAVKGYIVFRSKNTLKNSLELPSNSLAASLLFAYPVFAQVQKQPVRVEEVLVLLEFEYTDPDGDGIYTAQIQTPGTEGEYEIITVLEFQDQELGAKEIRLITVVDPEGYIYEQSESKQIRVPGASVSLYWLNPTAKQFELWRAQAYHQENPQKTDITGRYSFLVPEGTYHLSVQAAGYMDYVGSTFEVKEGTGIHMNIELKPVRPWWSALDWKIVAIVIFGVLLFYNFWRDKMKK